jgi:hypothetical protein
MVTLGWVLIIIGFSMEVINKELPAGGPIRYPWWMVIVVTPFMLLMALAQAAIDNNRLVTNIIGAIVSYQESEYITIDPILNCMTLYTIMCTKINIFYRFLTPIAVIMQITFLSALFLTAVGILLALYGIIIFLHVSIEIQGADGLAVDSSTLQFCGAALSAVFWVDLR